MIWWLALALAQEAPEIRPDDGRPTESVELGGERGEFGIKKQVDPAFPDEARKQGLSYGRCVVDLDVDGNGNPGAPAFVDCPEVFHRSATEALRQWRWHTETGGDGLPIGAKTRVIIDYRDDSPTALLANPDPLSTPIDEFGTIADDREICVGHATISASGQVLDKSANRLPDCIFEPAGDTVMAKEPQTVLASCTARFVTDRGYAMKIKFGHCDKPIRAATGKNLRSWTWPWTPENPVSYEMTLTYLAE